MENESTVLIDGKKLRRLREQRKLTQLFLATAVEVSTETVSRWENNRSPTIKRENALRIAEALEVSLEDLLKSTEIDSEFIEQIDENAACFPPPVVERERRPIWQWAAGGMIALVLGSLLAWRFLVDASPQDVSAFRFLPRHCLPNRSFPVLIKLEAAVQTGSFMLRERLPDHCSVLAAFPPRIETTQTPPQLKWVIAGEHQQSFAVVYLLQPQTMQPGEQIHFSGNIVVGHRGAKEPPVGGEGMTEVSVYHWADENRDNRIDDYEMLSVLDLFPEGGRLGMDMEEVEAIWAGHGYRWNPDHEKLEIL